MEKNMLKIELSLKLFTICKVSGNNVSEFVKDINSSGLFTYIEDFYEDTKYDESDEFDVMIFKINS